MSVSFYVCGWDRQPSRQEKIYVKDEFPLLDASHFVDSYGYYHDEGGWHRFETVYENAFPTFNTGSAPWAIVYALLELFNYNQDDGFMEVKDIPVLRRKIISVINTDQVQATEPRIYGRMIECGISEERIKRVLNSLDEVAAFAQKKNAHMYWS
jgi:hypothetical protein